MTALALREKLQAARQERIQLTERWLQILERVSRQLPLETQISDEEPHHVGQLSQVVEHLPDHSDHPCELLPNLRVGRHWLTLSHFTRSSKSRRHSRNERADGSNHHGG